MLKLSLLLVLGLAVAVLAGPLPLKHKRDIYGIKRDFILNDAASIKRDRHIDKRNIKRDSVFNVAQLKRDILLRYDKRDYPYDVAQLKRAIAFPYDKRDYDVAGVKRDGLLDKRSISFVQTQPQAQPAPGSTTIYYYVQNPDGTVSLVSTGGQPQVQQPIVVQQPQTSSGLLGPVVSRPLSAVGNIVGTVADTANSVLALPFNVVDQALQGVGLSDTGVGQVAEGVLDVGEKVVQAPLNLVSGLVQAPLKLLGKK